MSAQDGSPAFPVVAGGMVYSKGMELRDWFAGQAINGLIAGLQGARSEGEAAKLVGSMAYCIADAMIAARTPTGAS